MPASRDLDAQPLPAGPPPYRPGDPASRRRIPGPKRRPAPPGPRAGQRSCPPNQPAFPKMPRNPANPHPSTSSPPPLAGTTPTPQENPAATDPPQPTVGPLRRPSTPPRAPEQQHPDSAVPPAQQHDCARAALAASRRHDVALAPAGQPPAQPSAHSPCSRRATNFGVVPHRNFGSLPGPKRHHHPQ